MSETTIVSQVMEAFVFTRDGLSVRAEIDHTDKTYSIHPGISGDCSIFQFLRQRLPKSHAGTVAALIVEAVKLCESKLCESKLSAIEPPPTKDIFGARRRPDYEVLDVTDAETGKRPVELPDELVHPTTGERLVRVSPSKAEQIQELLERAGVVWAPGRTTEAAKTLDELLRSKTPYYDKDRPQPPPPLETIAYPHMTPDPKAPPVAGATIEDAWPHSYMREDVPAELAGCVPNPSDPPALGHLITEDAQGNMVVEPLAAKPARPSLEERAP